VIRRRPRGARGLVVRSERLECRCHPLCCCFGVVAALAAANEAGEIPSL
jgi:hypothetical protein